MSCCGPCSASVRNCSVISGSRNAPSPAVQIPLENESSMRIPVGVATPLLAAASAEARPSRFGPGQGQGDVGRPLRHKQRAADFDRDSRSRSIFPSVCGTVLPCFVEVRHDARPGEGTELLLPTL